MINSIPLGSWQWKMLFRDGRMNFKMPFLKIEKLSEFLIPLSRLFHSITVDGKYEFLKNVYIDLTNVSDISCSTCSPKCGRG